MELTHHHFPAFFRAVHGHEPFPWQRRLVAEWLDAAELDRKDVWPDVLDLPTASGKTAALDAAVFHLALRADEPWRSAIRIAFVVDRRIVVDSAYTRAQKISRALGDPSSVATGRTVVEEVARRLGQLAGPESPPLVAARLRGGAPLEHVWARTPTQPTILCSTVDQIGSRLLFRGYGVSNSMRPIHAGLLGDGALVLLDEAHLSEPFRQTLSALRTVGKAAVRAVLLTATPGIQAGRKFGGLKEEDRVHPVLQPRIGAAKRVRLELVKESLDDAAEPFARAAQKMQQQLQKQGIPAPAIGVVVNRVRLAREIHEQLKTDEEVESILMIGRARGVDRDRIAERLQPLCTGAETDRNRREKPTLIVATQCLEVGVDLDLDGLVSQAASLDALRQRFGRLQRGGRPSDGMGAILALKEDIGKRTDDPVYGDRIHKTWSALNKIAHRKTMDFGAEALDATLAHTGAPVAELAAPNADAPIMMPAYTELWAQTSPIPQSDPEVGLFLHGAERGIAEVSVLWRDDILETDLKEDIGKTDLGELLTLVPPRASETIQLPLWTVKRWLSSTDGGDSALDQVADAPQKEGDAPPVYRRTALRAFRWAGPGHPRTAVVRPADIHPGDLLVVPADYGGCDEFGWNPTRTEAVCDVGEEAAKPYRSRRHAVRLRRSRLGKSWGRVSDVLASDDAGAGKELVHQLLEALDDETRDPAELVSVRESLRAMTDARHTITSHHPYGDDGVVLSAARGLGGTVPLESSAPTTEDATLSHVSAGPVSLDDHACHVAEQAEQFARTLRLPCAMAQDLRLAAFLHDAGKSDPRFQTLLAGGDAWNAPTDSVLAKSGHWPTPGSWSRAGLPDGWRHEALSVRLARRHPRFPEAHDPALVLWLIGTHHGHGRPLFGFADPASDTKPHPAMGVATWPLRTDEPGPNSLAFNFDGADWPALGQVLQQRYGVWRLAFLEAVLRLADHRASQDEEKGRT